MSPTGTQLAELAYAGASAYAIFGYSVAISGTTAVVGEPTDGAGAGRAFVFTKTAAGWDETAELKGPDGVVGDGFGSHVAISGPTIVVAAPFHASDAGRAYVLTRTTAGWDETELEGSGTGAGDFFAGPVAISANTIVIGAGQNHAYVFTKTATGWHQSSELSGTPDGSFGGESVAISGTTIVVGGATGWPVIDQAYVFTNTTKGWRHTAVLTGSQPASSDGFGASVAVSGTTLAVGAQFQGGTIGAVYVFTHTAKGWYQTAELKGSGIGSGDLFGNEIALSGTTLVAGTSAPESYAGRAYVFTNIARGWRQSAVLKGSDTVAHDAFGVSVAVSGPTIVVGASAHASATGRAYVFEG